MNIKFGCEPTVWLIMSILWMSILLLLLSVHGHRRDPAGEEVVLGMGGDAAQLLDPLVDVLHLGLQVQQVRHHHTAVLFAIAGDRCRGGFGLPFGVLKQNDKQNYKNL